MQVLAGHFNMAWIFQFMWPVSDHRQSWPKPCCHCRPPKHLSWDALAAQVRGVIACNSKTTEHCFWFINDSDVVISM